MNAVAALSTPRTAVRGEPLSRRAEGFAETPAGILGETPAETSGDRSGDLPLRLGYPEPAVSPSIDDSLSGSPALPGSAALPERLRRAVDESSGLLGAAGSMLYLLDADGILRWAHDSGIATDAEASWFRSLQFPIGVGLFGRAVSEGRAMTTADYGQDSRFVHAVALDRFVREMQVRSMVVAPLIGSNGPLGALGAFSHEPDAFGEPAEALMTVLAEHAALAMDNASLIDQLAGSREEIEGRAHAERSLREIAARITAIRDPATIGRLVVDESHRLLHSDYALLALVSDGELHSPVVSGDLSPEARRVLETEHLHVRGSLLGAAMTARSAVTSSDYVADVVAVDPAANVAMVELLGLRGVAIAPLRVEDRVCGLLAVWCREPRTFTAAELELLQGMADVAAIAVDNAHLTEDLRSSEQRFRFMTERSPDVIAAIDAPGRFTYVSARARELVGWDPEALVGRHFRDLIHESSLATIDAQTADRVLDPTVEHQYRVNLVHRDGHPVPVEVRSVGIVVNGVFVGTQTSVRDMTERDRMERDLRRQEAELAASQERAKLAQELHDSVTQALFSMTLTTRSAEMLLQRNPAQVPEKLAELRGLASDALAEMRGLIFELRPGSLDQDGLAVAIRKHAAAVQGRTGMPVIVETGEVERLAPGLEETLYRIVQEALHNVVKHAHASETRIHLGCEDGATRLVVSDNGVGFDPSGITGSHLGLEGIRSRVARVGASLIIESRPGAGTRIDVLVPREQPGDPSEPAQ